MERGRATERERVCVYVCVCVCTSTCVYVGRLTRATNQSKKQQASTVCNHFQEHAPEHQAIVTLITETK
jgi:uncharacterized protein YceK